MAHRFFGLFLLLLVLTAALALTVNGFSYYTSSLSERAFMPEHKSFRPSGEFSHGLGIIGATMIIVGVTMYSTRKRVRALWSLGRLSVWLEVHITLCLLGPVLVIYHSTFKTAGIAGISLWTMLSVAASGIVGRFLYVLIPRNSLGSELSRDQINQEFDRMSKVLVQSEEGKQILAELDKRFAGISRPRNIRETFVRYFQIQRMKSETAHWITHLLSSRRLPRDVSHHLRAVAHARSRLLQRSILLLQAEKLFYYWHAIHLPFTVIMFITLAVHVGVGIWLGYTWIF